MSNEWKNTPLEQSKRLMELGAVVYGTERCWMPRVYWPSRFPDLSQGHTLRLSTECLNIDGNSILKDIGKPDEGLYPAPDAAELGKVLPKNVGDYWLRIEPDDAGWNVTYFYDGSCLGKKPLVSINAETLSECMSTVLIWLIENGHVDPAEISQKEAE